MLKKIVLKNFRNFEYLEFEPQNGINYIYGLNGVGKTNIVEAISCLSLGKSFKNIPDKIMINVNKEQHFYIKGITEKNILEIGIDKKNKVRKKDNVEIKRARDYVGCLKSVIFSGEDLNLINGTPAEKRKYLDILLSQTDSLYLEYLILYRKLVEQKNYALKQENINSVYVQSLNEQLTPYNVYIKLKRDNFLIFINEHIEEIYEKLSGKKESISVEYKTNVIDNLNLNDLLNTEINKRSSVYGIHRDTFDVIMNGFSAVNYASQGQQKMLVLTLKVLQNMYLEIITGEKPIFILDDVFSELDATKKDFLLSHLLDMGNQVFITTTEIGDKKDFVHYYNLCNQIICEM